MQGIMEKVWERKEGFTLVELLIVVAIIGVLAGIAIPNFLGARRKARIAKAFSDMDAVAKAEEMYYIDNVYYAESLGDLDPTYINVAPSDDPWGTGYHLYTSPATDPTMYVILSDGPDSAADIAESDIGWADGQRVRGPVGGTEGYRSGYNVAASEWYYPASGRTGDIGYGGG